VDFELSLDWRDLAQSTTTSSCGRTPLYAAPEVIELKKCNSKADIWSLGCVFLEMATVIKGKSVSQLRQHFRDQTESALFFNNLKGIKDWIAVLENVSTIDNAPLLWISKMLQPDLNLRSRSAALIDIIRNSDSNAGEYNQYFGACCQYISRNIDLRTLRCLICNAHVLMVGFPDVQSS
jgi:serine/threonine protein kinase